MKLSILHSIAISVVVSSCGPQDLTRDKAKDLILEHVRFPRPYRFYIELVEPRDVHPDSLAALEIKGLIEMRTVRRIFRLETTYRKTIDFRLKLTTAE